jgi:hypothetical protein
MRLVVFAIFFLVLLSSVSALRINEVMYNPTPTTDPYNEWIEIYNEGDYNIDLTGWKINDKEFNENITLKPDSYLIIARKLLGGTTSNPDSFESVWGNGDGVWDSNDGNYLAVQISFGNGLSNTGGTINLKDNLGDINSSISYSKEMGANGNGRSLQYCSGDWVEKEPTPGEENDCSEEQEQTQQETNEEEQIIEDEDEENPLVEEISVREEAAAEPQPEENQIINLNPKVIKTENDNENLGESENKNVNYAVYEFIAFCILLGVLFLMRRNKYETEFV